MHTATEKRRYPIGQYIPLLSFDAFAINESIAQIQALPAQLHTLLAAIQPNQESWTYRAQSWTIRQIVHHLADTHLNGFVRCKLAFTAACPTVAPYDENAWSQTCDATEQPLIHSLSILNGLHARWSNLLLSNMHLLTVKHYYHPQLQQNMYVWQDAHKYAWHGLHHLAHIQLALQDHS
jgi:hypothetical protein